MRVRAFFVVCILAVLALSSQPQNAFSQTKDLPQTSAEAPAEADTVRLNSKDEIEAAYRAVKRNEAYQYDLAEPIARRPPSKLSLIHI